MGIKIRSPLASGGVIVLEEKFEDQNRRANCCLHILEKGFLPDIREKHLGVKRCKFTVTCYLFNMLCR